MSARITFKIKKFNQTWICYSMKFLMIKFQRKLFLLSSMTLKILTLSQDNGKTLETIDCKFMKFVHKIFKVYQKQTMKT